jgi:antitoxin ParD1/3/4
MEAFSMSSNVEKISIALSPELAVLMRECIGSGEYVSVSEIVREALRDWKTKRALVQYEIAEAQRLWQEGIQSGQGRFKNMSEIKAEARRRLLSDGNDLPEN